MNEMSRIRRDPYSAELESIRHGFGAALATDLVANVAARRFDLRIASSGLDAARSNLAAVAQQDGDTGTADAHRDASAACDAAALEVAETRARADAAVAEAAPHVRASLSAPLEAQQRIALDLLAQLERATDPMIELQAALNAHGLPLPPTLASVPALLERLREMRRILGRGSTAEHILNRATETSA